MTYFIIILILLLFIYFFFKSHIKEKFWWVPTRSTRLMSYDIRGDPFGYYLYPYYPWGFGVPYQYYLYSPARYDIFGRYIVPKPRENKKTHNLKKEPKITSKKE